MDVPDVSTVSTTLFLQAKKLNNPILVDYVAFPSHDHNWIEWFKRLLTSTFKVKIVGQLWVFIGWHFTYSRHGTYIREE